MLRPKISVIMAVYNAEKYLVQSIDAMLNQSFKNFEFIIINDHSSDASLAILHQFRKKDPRILVLNNKKRLYPAGARNRGLRIARGDYIAIQDADDISLPQRLEKQCHFMDSHTSIFLLGTRAIIIDRFGRKVNSVEPAIEEEKLRKDLTNANALCHSSMMFRNTGDYFYRRKMRYAHDYDLYLRMLSDGKKILCIPDYLVVYRLTPRSISQAHMIKQILFSERAKKFYKQRERYGDDHYDQFNSKAFLTRSTHLSMPMEKMVLESCITKSFTINECNNTKHFLRKYFQNYGFLNKYLLYGILVNLPIALIKLIRSTKHFFKSTLRRGLSCLVVFNLK
ncbi:glycosyltransferase [Candidatus Peregrinibacteria bacterium]|nr:glycosyltransferase [Candidatus Peregrinibacteria bacterium]